MRALIFCAVLFAGSLTPALAGTEQEKAKEKPKTKSADARVAKDKAPAGEEVKVYTNADLEKLVGPPKTDAAKPAAAPQAAEPGKPAEAQAGAKPAVEQDSLKWLRQRQQAQQAHRKALAEAETALSGAKARLANLEKQLLATRNPFSARPELSDEEKGQRQEAAETAAQRYERTKELVEKAREEVRAAEAELARLRAGRP